MSDKAIEQVRLWVISKGIGHVVWSSDTRWHITPHNLMIIGGKTSKAKPRRICSKCRKVLVDQGIPII